MKRLYSKYSLVVGVCLLTALTLISWQGVQADWVHRLFDRAGFSLSKAQPELTVTRVQTDKATATFSRVADLSPSEGTLAGQPVASVLTDLNEDGRLDLVTAFANSLVTVRNGKADGSFDSPRSFSIDAQVGAMAAGDFNGDGHLDLLIADTATETLSVLAGDGRGGLPQAQRVKLVGAPSRLIVKDFLGDQRAEVLVAVTTGAQTELLLWQDIAWLHPMSETALQGTEPRTLALNPTRFTVPWQGVPSQIDVGYVDSDSYADILVIGEQQISVLYGDRTAPFQRHATVSLEQPLLASVVGDFNGDVRAEVAVLDSLTHDVVLYASDAAGEWGVRQRLNVGVTATALAAADINGDRVDDLIVMRPEAGQVAIFLGGRQNRLGGELVHTIRGGPVMALPAYLDRDELTDLVIIKQQGVSLLLTAESADQPTQGGVGDSPITAIDPLEYDVQIPEGECRTVPVTITIAPTVFRPLDIYLLVDDTQSFNDNIPNFVRSADRFVQDLVNLRGDIRLGIGKFRDYPIRPFGTLLDFAYRRVTDFKQVNIDNRAALISAIHSIVTEGGGDDPEAQLPALFQAATGAGQDFPPSLSRAKIPPNQQASFRQNVDVEKIIVLLTDSNFHNAGDPGQIPYPAPSFADTIAALNARGIKVIGVAAGGPGGDASITINALRQIATATNTRARRDIDCDGNGTIDIRRGDPIVCPPPANGVALKDVVLSVVRGFDLPVPLTLEIDRDCSPITFMIDPPVQFVDPLTGGTFTFNITFCCPCPSAPFACRFETKVILDEIIRARIPSRVECVRPVCEVSPPSLNFGEVCVGANAEQMIFINNTGNGSFTVNQVLSDNPAFTVVATSSPLPATVAPGETLRARIRFTCTSGGPQSGTISFVTDPPRNCVTDPLCAPVPVSGFCVNISGDATPRNIAFGDVCVGSSATQTFTVTNTGNRPFTVSPASSNPAFTVTPASATIDPAGSATFTVTFTCTTPGPQSGTITLNTSNANNCPFNLGVINVSGTCLQVAGDVNPRTIDFGDVCVGTSADRTFTVSNTGNAPFTINSITSSNAAFTIVSPALPVTVPVGGNVVVTVRLTCTSPGPQSGTLSFAADSVCGPVALGTVNLTGTCVLIACDVSPRSIDFGDVCVGASADRTFTVSNTGNRPFTIDGISSSSGAFTIVSPALPVPVPAGGNVTVTVRLTCTTPGPQSGTISFNTSSACGPIACGTVNVTGFCVRILCDVSPRTINFGDVCVGQNATRTFTVSNTGNRPFTINSISSSNSAFTIVSPTLPATVPAGGSVTVTVRLTCTSPGPQSGTITFNTSSQCGPIDCGTVNVSGTCIQPVCAVSPTTINFGDVCVGTSANQTFTVSNTGNAPFTINAINSSNPAFTIVSPALPVIVPAGGSVTVTVRFTCTAPGAQSGTITFNTTSACGPINCGTVTVSGTCLLITCAVSPTTINFGNVCVGATSDQTFTVSNTGNAPFTINAINSSNPAFSVTSPVLPVTVPVGGSVSVVVRFTCTAPGPQSGTLSFSTSSACGPINCGTVSLSGTCLQITGTVDPATINFGDVCVGSNADRTFTIRNTGNGPFTVSSLTPNNAAFTVVSPTLPITLNPGETATVTVRFTCTTPGEQIGQIVVNASSPCGPILVGVVDLLGFCVQITCDASPRTIDFGNVCVGANAEQGFKVRNTGNRPFTITAINSSNPAFTIVSPPLPVTIPAGGSQGVVVRFTCTTPGPQSGTISFVTQSQCGPVDCGTVTVSGVCVQPVCAVAPSSLDFGEVCAGTSSDRTLTVSNAGNTAFTITAINSSNPAFTIVSPALPVTVPVGGSVTVTVRLTCPPGSRDRQNGTISFTTTSLCGPVLCPDIPVTGQCRVGPVCAVAPATLNLGEARVNPNAPPPPPLQGTVTISNTGDLPLTITGFSSNDPRCRVVTPLPITIAPGGSATVTVECEVREIGTRTARITFIVDQGSCPAANCFVDLRFTGFIGPFCIFVQPLGTPPNFNFDLPFPDIVLGDMTTQNGLVQILNLGDRPLILNQGGRAPVSTNLSFTVVGYDINCDGVVDTPTTQEITLQPGDVVCMLVKFTGLDIGEQVGAIQIFTNQEANDLNNPACVLKNVRGRVVRPPQCQLTPDALTLNAFAACSSDQQTVTVANVGDVGLVISNITTTNAEVVVLDPATNAPPVLPITVPGGGAAQFLVRCTPLSVGTRTAVIRFVTNDRNPTACILNVTCVATQGPICQVVMPDTTNGAPDGKTFGEVVIVLPSDPRFGTVGPSGLPFGRKQLPIEVRNIGDQPLRLLAPPAPFPSNPFVTNTDFTVTGFTVGMEIPPGGVATGTVTFTPTLRRLQQGTIRFFTNTCVGECVITGVNGIGVTNAIIKSVSSSLNVGSAPVGGSVEASFPLQNVGDRDAVINDPSQIVIDNPRFSVVTPLPIVVPAEFSGRPNTVPVRVRFTPTAVGEQLGRITLNFAPTDIGPVTAFSINVSGTGTMSSANVISPGAVDNSVPVRVTGGTRSVMVNQE